MADDACIGDMLMEEETQLYDDSAENHVLNGDIEDTENDNEDGVSDGGDPGEQHEFEIIDQVESEEEAEDGGELRGGQHRRNRPSGQNGQGESEDSSDSDEFDDTELHALLEKGIDKESLSAKQKNEVQTEGGPIIRNKVVLRELDSDPFDILPEGWVCATHNCGMPVYLHKESRVCTMARPYYLGAASTRKHDIPISAIPCLQYRNQLKKLQNDGKEPDEKGKEPDQTEAKQAHSTACHENESSPQECTTASPHPTESESSQQHPAALSSSSSERSSTQKPQMWMVTEESSSFVKCSPSDVGKEALHTGKEDYKDAASSCRVGEGEISVHTSCGGSDVKAPKSPGGENIAVTFESSTLLDNEDTSSVRNGLSDSSENEQAKTLHSGAMLPVEETDVKMMACVSEANGAIENMDDLSDSSKDATDCKISRSTISCPLSSTVDTCPSKNDSIVAEEASNSLEPSEIVTSTTSTSDITHIKRKIDDLRRRGGKFRKLGCGSALPSSSSSLSQLDNNIAVSSTNAESADVGNGQANTTDERLKAHIAEVKIKTAEERAKECLLDIKTVHEYCTKLFQFKTIVVKKYRTWRERRKHLGERNRSNRPELPSSTKLITCPIIGNNKPNGSLGVGKKKEFVLNPSGKSFLCILHEYMQRTLKIQPTYVFKELENSKTPYGATVMINNIEYGTGYASSKKMAKQEAAKETLKILIPDLSNKISDHELKHSISDLSFFDEIKVEDPRVYELGNKVGQPSPFQLLRECLRRNFGMGNTQCDVNTTALKNQKCEFTIKVGKHTATVVAKNKRDGKQLAAQAILAKLHPHVPSWGSLLRLYTTNVEKPMEKIEEMNEIKTHVPNKAVLESLREEMRKLHKQKEAIQSKGKMVISSRDLPVKMSGVDL